MRARLASSYRKTSVQPSAIWFLCDSSEQEQTNLTLGVRCQSDHASSFDDPDIAGCSRLARRSPPLKSILSGADVPNESRLQSGEIFRVYYFYLDEEHRCQTLVCQMQLPRK